MRLLLIEVVDQFAMFQAKLSLALANNLKTWMHAWILRFRARFIYL